MKELIGVPRGKGAVEADDVEVPVLNPEAAYKAGFAAVAGFGRDIQDDAAQVAEEFAALVIVVVVLLIESPDIHEHHPGEAFPDELRPGVSSHPVQGAIEESRLGMEGLLFQCLLEDDAGQVVPAENSCAEP